MTCFERRARFSRKKNFVSGFNNIRFIFNMFSPYIKPYAKILFFVEKCQTPCARILLTKLL